MLIYIKSIDGGHESKEDATACMDLMKWKIKSDLQKTTRNLTLMVVVGFIFAIRFIAMIVYKDLIFKLHQYT